MLYCHVVDNQIQTTARPLPAGITEETAISNGWYPAVFLNMPHHIESECNVVTQYIKMNMEFDGSIVKITHVIENKSQEDIILTEQILLKNIREDRNKKLLLSDWTQLPNAAGLTQSQKDAWEQYRQQLREFPSTVNLSNVQWPVEPN